MHEPETIVIHSSSIINDFIICYDIEEQQKSIYYKEI